MINVNQITSQLARMPDQALQQYAMMHKNDPYTVSLALSESNRRKERRIAAQGQQGMAPQPKVVDQGIAGMAAPAPQPMPEDVGIGALPAPNMQGMAGGGIVAFGGGGDVQHFQSGGSPASRFFSGVRQSFADAEETTRLRNQLLRKYGPASAVPGLFMQQSDEERQAAKAVAAALPNLSYAQLQQLAQNGPSALTGAPVSAAAPVAIPNPTDQRLANKTQTAPTDTILPAPGAVPGDIPVAGGPRPAPAPAAPRAPVVQEKDFLTLQRELEGQYGAAVDPLKAERAALTTKEKAGEEEGLAKLKADQESEMKTMFKGREERIGKREAELGKFKDTNTGMALLEAGLAMMQSRGPGLAGIAQGAGVGLKQYAAGIDKIKSAQEKLDDARDRVEELRQSQSAMNKSEVRKAEQGIRAIVNQGNRDLFKGLETATGKKEADVRAAVTNAVAVSQADKARATTLEAARIAAEPGLARNKMLAASQSDTAKARTEYGKLQAKVMSDLSADPQYTMATDAVKAQMATTRLRAALLNNPFLSAYAAGIGFSSAPAGTGAVRELDED
jgi:hypothetical protein